ncbi:MAG: glutamate racemase [Bacteroidales bacterium]|nr:glutamate racemase [Bacteroidales bacterium]
MVGIFDSGIGGLSVWLEASRLMPGEHFIYFADGAACPYGPKSPEFIIERVSKITDYFISRGVNLIIVACNTATAAAISFLREKYDIPFVGMEPALKPAALKSKSGVVGILATAGTFKGRLYLNNLARLEGSVKVIERVGDGLVEAVENGDFCSEKLQSLLASYIEPMLDNGADHIVLGCTHYPFLIDAIENVVQGRAEIINPAKAVAMQAKRLLTGINEKSGDSADAVAGTEFLTSRTTLYREDILGRFCEQPLQWRHFPL